MPVTIPPAETVALTLSEDHRPAPASAGSDKLIFNPAVTAVAPLMMPADNPIMVTTVVVLTLPQLPLME